jgi:hypothetical protein
MWTSQSGRLRSRLVTRRPTNCLRSREPLVHARDTVDSYVPSGQCFAMRSSSASLNASAYSHVALCEAVTKLVQHLGNGYDGILVVVTDLAVDLEPRLGVRAEDSSLIPVCPQHDGHLHRLLRWKTRLRHARLPGRAPRMPDEVVGQRLRRPLPDNTAGIATWLDAREPSRGGDLTLKRSDPGMARARSRPRS